MGSLNKPPDPAKFDLPGQLMPARVEVSQQHYARRNGRRDKPAHAAPADGQPNQGYHQHHHAQQAQHRQAKALAGRGVRAVQQSPPE